MNLFLQLRMIVRAWYRNLLSSTISLISLTIGILLSSVLLLFVLNEYNTASALGNTEDCYVIEQADAFKPDVMTKEVYKQMATRLGDRIPEIEQTATFTLRRGTWNEIKPAYNSPQVTGMTPSVCEMLNIPIEEGDLRKTLSSPDEIAVTRSFANTICKGNPMGQSVKYDYKDYYKALGQQDLSRTFTITTILKDPVRLPLQYLGITAVEPKELDNDAQTETFYGMVKLRHGVSKTTVEQKIATDSLSNEDASALVPFSDVYFSASDSDSVFFASRSKTTLLIGLTIALAILLVAVFNYINMTMTRATQRLKNLSGQRIMGATKWNVRWQTVVETAFNVLLALVIVVAAIKPTLNTFNSFMDSTLTGDDFLVWSNLKYMLLLVAGLIALPSLYIIAKLEIGRPLETFKAPRAGRAKVIRTMVILQFAVSVVLIAVSLNITRQIGFITSALPESESILTIRARGEKLPLEFIDRLKSQSSTLGLISAGPRPSMYLAQDGINTNITPVPPDFFAFFGVKIIEGRTVDSMKTVGASNVVVNQAFVKSRDLKEPLNHEFNLNGEDLKIVGICENFMTDNAQNAIQPSVFWPQENDRQSWQLCCRTTGDINDRLQSVKELYASCGGAEANMDIQTLATFYLELNKEATRMRTMVTFFTIINIILTAIGMFGMSWYTVQGRIHEIAVRKIHGATTAQMVSMLCRSFFTWVGIAVIIALPVAYYLTDRWLTQFTYKTSNSLWVLVATILAIGLITFLTVIWQTYRAANTNPAQSIKTE